MADLEAAERTDAFPVDRRNRVKRRPDRGRYDRASIYPILDAAMVCHIAYVLDGQPYCTPTGFWREGDTLYWHGSSASRMIERQGEGLPVCLTVTHLDAIVQARCGFNHSINYRSVMAYGTARMVEGEDAKLRAMDAFMDRFFPGRSKMVRPASRQEIKATSFVWMDIEQASGKIRDVPPHDDEDDYAVPAWTAMFPVRQIVGEPVECERQMPGLPRGSDTAEYQAGQRLDEILTRTYRQTFG